MKVLAGGPHVRIRAAFSLISFAIPLIYLIAHERGGASALPGVFIFATLLGGLPPLIYLFGVRTRIGSALTGVALVLIYSFTQVYVHQRSEAGSSTATLGYLSLLFYGAPLVLIVVTIESFGRLPPKKKAANSSSQTPENRSGD